jgi:hypothetical protein
MKTMVDTLTSPRLTRAATITDTPDRSNRPKSASQSAVEYWIARIMWLVVAVTSAWDIVETFGGHFT